MIRGPWLRRAVLAAAALALAAGAGLGQGSAPEGGVAPGAEAPVLVGAVEGAIGPATVRHVERLVEMAAERQAEALVLRLNTPGGLTDSTREIIAEILGSPVPVIGWVAPPGAHAASAGTYILYATHLAAMAPATNIGAATPVQLGGAPGMPDPGQPGPGAPGRPAPEPADGGPTDDQPAEDREDAPAGRGPLGGSDAMSAKVTNDAVAFIRSLAEMRGRNADWAERAVREAATLSADAAAAEGVVELVAEDLDDLLAAADGRAVTVFGDERVLATASAPVEIIEAGAITRLLGVISNPNIALVLMMIGIYGMIFEFMNPGTVVPGVIGAICLTLGLFALNQLPLDYAGLALIILGVAFMVAEALSPSFGVLGFGGLLAFVLGSAMLIDTDVPEYQISWWLIAAMAAASGAVLILLLGVSWRAYRRAPASTAPMQGVPAEVLDWSGGAGHVHAEGERWNAVGPADLRPGDCVRVEAMDGLTLTVARSEADPPAGEGRKRWSR
jgi:membrane-bound serine protease (ClpP class)